MRLEVAGLERAKPIKTLMTKNLDTCDIKDKLKEAVRKMVESGHRRLPVTKKRKLVGILCISDLLPFIFKPETPVKAIMKKEVITCESEDPLGYVLHKMKFSGKGALPVVKKDKLVGIVTEWDFVKNFAEIRFDQAVKDVMSSEPLCIASNYSLKECIKTFLGTGYRRLPVVDDKLIGLVTSSDLIRFLFFNDFNEEYVSTSVKTIMVRQVHTIEEDKDICESISIMKEKSVGGLPVVKNAKLTGMITERDIFELLE